MNTNKAIVVVGYPKSGNTWITRLTAELVKCPVIGFWNEPDNPEIAKEGLNRISSFECYKSHHQLAELIELPKQSYKTIYLVRDPRDIIISGINYFGKNNKLIPFWDTFILMKIINRLYSKSIFGKRKFKIMMINAVLKGNIKVHKWCRISWLAHIDPFIRHNMFLVKYEDMLEEPLQECRRILKHLGIERTECEIISAIKKQSFDSKKKSFLKMNQKTKAQFLRQGRSGYWKNELTQSQIAGINNCIGEKLRQLGYQLQ